MVNKALLYDLAAIITEDLAQEVSEMAEVLGLAEMDLATAVNRRSARYAEGSISQGDYWAEVAATLLLEDLEIPSAFAMRSAVANSELLAYIRTQSAACILGLVSDATPDWVGHWRKIYRLDKLMAVHVIDSELGRRHSYEELLTLAAERLQAKVHEVTFVDHKPVHLAAARRIGMSVVDTGSEEWSTLLKAAGH